MITSEPRTSTKTVRFHSFGEPADVLRLEWTDLPQPGIGRIRVAVHACGLTPADWASAGAYSRALCLGE